MASWTTVPFGVMAAIWAGLSPLKTCMIGRSTLRTTVRARTFGRGYAELTAEERATIDGSVALESEAELL